jgi:hypothetical protein
VSDATQSYHVGAPHEVNLSVEAAVRRKAVYFW